MQSVKRLVSTLGLKPAALWLQTQLSHLKAARQWRILASQSLIKLELGSGRKLGAHGWTTIDLRGADISFNIMKGIPLPDASVSYIYSSHFLEHIPRREQLKLLRECLRVLKPGAIFSVSVPDAGRYIKYYLTQDYESITQHQAYEPARVNTGSLMDGLNYVAYMDGHHKYMFDRENLINSLKQVPFSEVALREFDPTIDPFERRDDSIYAVATK